MNDIEDKYREAAKATYQNDDDFEVDDDAKVSLGENGAFVQVWVWFDKDEIPVDEETI